MKKVFRKGLARHKQSLLIYAYSLTEVGVRDRFALPKRHEPIVLPSSESWCPVSLGHKRRPRSRQPRGGATAAERRNMIAAGRSR